MSSIIPAPLSAEIQANAQNLMAPSEAFATLRKDIPQILEVLAQTEQRIGDVRRNFEIALSQLNKVGDPASIDTVDFEYAVEEIGGLIDNIDAVYEQVVMATKEIVVGAKMLASQ